MNEKTRKDNNEATMIREKQNRKKRRKKTELRKREGIKGISVEEISVKDFVVWSSDSLSLLHLVSFCIVVSVPIRRPVGALTLNLCVAISSSTILL